MPKRSRRGKEKKGNRNAKQSIRTFFRSIPNDPGYDYFDDTESFFHELTDSERASKKD